MSRFQRVNLDEFTPDCKDVLLKNLILSKSDKETKKEVDISREWFGDFDIAGMSEVEIFVQGDHDRPNHEFMDMAQNVLAQFPEHLEKALEYLKVFFPHQESADYYLSEIFFGQIFMLEGFPIKGFALVFTYGDYPDAFQFKVKFKENGWPIGFEGGPL